MKFVTFKAGNGKTGPGVLMADGVVDISAKHADVLSIIRNGAAVEASGPVLPLSGVELLAPILNPPRIFCVGLNYRDHAIESKMEIPKVPTIFFKLASALTGHKSPVNLPAASTQVDYEAEFAVVIGKEARNVSKENWREYVFGYTILNDVSARDVQLSTSQWSLGKSFDTFAPLGPSIVTKDEIADPHSLQISLSIDGEALQNSNTRELIFNVPDLIAYISAIAPLQPGDIISTGTPQGVGLGRTPQRWLRSGETMAVTIDGLGTLTNPVV
jgi:2-keto-4-pentenoate hydratase/2-oxohepta-3-ene-1,7-dioic acid hydratase in catechol pathway